MRFCICVWCVFALILLPPVYAQCRTEQDRLVWAREKMHPETTGAKLDLVYQWLVTSTRTCPLSGDLWYYRSLVEKRLSRSRDAVYSLSKADDNSSKAKSENFDPFFVVNHPDLPPNTVRDKFALLVGVEAVESSDDFLQFSVKDALALKRVLVGVCHFKDENVTVLTGEKATTQKIREAFGDIRSKAKPEDLVLVYFSSHGRPRELDPTGVSYVLTSDTDMKNPGMIYATALKMVELAELGRWVLAHDYVLLLDTCFSGSASAAMPPNGIDALNGLRGSGHRVVISASRPDERSYEDSINKHGFFTRFLLDGLQQSGDKDTLSTIFGNLEKNVDSQVSKVLGKQQHPVMNASGSGQDIVIGAPLLSMLVQPAVQHAQ